MIETARQYLPNERLIHLCGFWRKHRIENKLSVNNLKNINEEHSLIRQKIVRAERLNKVNSRQL